jgi:hypothetical protein
LRVGLAMCDGVVGRMRFCQMAIVYRPTMADEFSSRAAGQQGRVEKEDGDGLGRPLSFPGPRTEKVGSA